MTLGELSYYLSSYIKVLPSALALNIASSSVQDIYDENEWSFLLGYGYIRTPKLITLGSVSISQYENTTIVSNELKTELDAISQNDVSIIGRQFRTLSNENSIGSRIYTITDYDTDTSTLTLDDIYLGPTNSNTSYQIFKIYYNAPYLSNTQIIDFKSFKYVIDIVQQRKLYTDYSIDYINRYDVNRLRRDDVSYIIPYKYDNNNEQLFEFYSTPTRDRIYKVVYHRKGIKLENDEDVIPKQLTDELLRKKALSKIYDWCEANKGLYPELQKTSWINLKALLMNENNRDGYPQELQKNKFLDEQLYPKALLESYNNLDYCNNWLSEWDLGSDFEPARDTCIISF